jgi:hypothetical protein
MLYHVTSYQVGNSAFVPVQKNILSSSGSCSVEGSPQTVASPRLQQFAELLRASRAVAIVSACSACADATAESGSKRVLWRMREDGVFFGHLTWKSTIATCFGAYYGILWHIIAYYGIFMHMVGIYHFHATSTAAAGRHSWMKTIPLSPSQMARTKILGSALIYSPSFYFSQNWMYNLRLKLPYWMGFIMVSGKDFFNITHPLISGDIPIFWVMVSLNPLASPAISNGFPYHSPHVC